MNPELCLFSLLLVPLAAAGLALIHQGLGRSRSAAHAMLGTLCALAVSAIVFVLFGSSWAGSRARPCTRLPRAACSGTGWVRSVLRARHQLRWIGCNRPEPFAGTVSRDVCRRSGGDHSAERGHGPLAAGADLLRSALLAGIVFPLFAHWVWGGDGWRSWGRTSAYEFVDVGGAGTIQVVGGLAALSVAWIAGPRRGEFSDDGMAAAIPGHNIVQVLFGCLLALVGWIGLDSAAYSVLWSRATADCRGRDQRVLSPPRLVAWRRWWSRGALPQAGRFTQCEWMDRRAGCG